MATFPNTAHMLEGIKAIEVTHAIGSRQIIVATQMRDYSYCKGYWSQRDYGYFREHLGHWIYRGGQKIDYSCDGS